MNPNLPPYPAYKPSGVAWLGDVPAHWKVVPNWTLMKLKREVVGDRADDYVLLSLTKRGIIPRDMEKPEGKFPASFHTYQVLEPGDLVFCLFDIDETPRTVGLSTLHGMITGAYSRVVCNDEMTRKFLHLLYLSLDYNKSLRPLYSGLRKVIPKSTFLRAKSPLPPLPERHAIVCYLDHIDRRIQRYIDTKEKLIALLQEARNVATIEAMQSSSTTNLRLSAVANIVERPIKRASDQTFTPIGLYNRGRGIFRKEPRNGADLGDSDFFWIEEGDLVISGQFAWEGAIALAGDVEHGCVASHRFPILRGKPGIADTGFLLAFFQTGWGHLILDHNSRGAAGRNRPLNVRTLLKEKISLPPIGTQMRIAELLQTESRVLQQTRRMEQLLKEYRASLIAHVVTGKLDVRAAAERIPMETPQP